MIYRAEPGSTEKRGGGTATNLAISKDENQKKADMKNNLFHTVNIYIYSFLRFACVNVTLTVASFFLSKTLEKFEAPNIQLIWNRLEKVSEKVTLPVNESIMETLGKGSKASLKKIKRAYLVRCELLVFQEGVSDIPTLVW